MTDGAEHTECAVCGYEPDPDRVPPHYVLSLSDEDIDDEYVQSYPFGGSLSVPFACSDECWSDAQHDPDLITDGGRDLTCRKCGEEFQKPVDLSMHYRVVHTGALQLGLADERDRSEGTGTERSGGGDE